MTSDYSSIRAENKSRYGTDIGRIGPLLLAHRYDDRTHFIFELLQNAEDALARREGWDGPRAAAFELSKTELRVSHFGIPFDETDVRSICGIDASPSWRYPDRAGRPPLKKRVANLVGYGTMRAAQRRRCMSLALRVLPAVLACLAVLAAPADALPPRDEGWSGNFAKNPGFEEDFINSRAENHVLSFKGDWYYNQSDLEPDYWAFRDKQSRSGGWEWSADTPHGGGYCLKLEAGATATQSYPGAAYQQGGGNWGVPAPVPIEVPDPSTLAQPLRARVWVLNGGGIRLGAAQAKAEPSDQWQLLTVELPAAEVKHGQPVTVALVGPGEFDDLVVQEKLSGPPNLMANAGFESADENGHPVGWSEQRKYHAIGPTYYVWTDWNHAFRENRGAVTVDPLISHSGRQSLRFDVYPGDEKYVESGPIVLNQEVTGAIEVGVYVCADRIRLFDIRCVNQDGADLPGYLPMQSEYGSGGTATWGNGTFEWRYVRKFFAPALGRPTRSFRVRLCARGFNGHTLDDSGTRSALCQTGTIWWDDLRVTERGSDKAALAARGVAFPPATPAVGDIVDAELDLGERHYGANTLRFAFTNAGGDGTFRLAVTRTVPGPEPAATRSEPLEIKRGERGALAVPYDIPELAGDLAEQGMLGVALLRADGTLVAEAEYAFNTWPVIVDFDVARTYNLPDENPVTVSLNLGVGQGTLAQVARLDLALAKATDPTQVVEQLDPITDLPAALERTAAGLPKTKEESYEFGFPTPGWWVDRTNLLMLKVDLGALKIWPHDNPTRDTVLVARGLDAGGNVLFEDKSDPFCRMAAPPRQPAIESVEIRRDGAILINGRPRYLTGVMYASQRFGYDEPEVMSRLGVMGHRLWGKAGSYFESQLKAFDDHGLYMLQAKPIDLWDGHRVSRTVVEITDDQKQDLSDFVGAGGTAGTVSINTGGWEERISDDPEERARHQASNDWIRDATKRPVACSPSGAYNAWGDPMNRPFYDILHAETEMWGPMDYNTVAMPHIRKAKKTPTAWIYLPQLYDNTPYERYRFETYENIVRGSMGVAMIHGTGDPTLTRGLAGELRRLEGPLNSLEEAPAVTLEPNVSHKTTRYRDKTYVLATNCGPIIIGDWTWEAAARHSGRASHEGDTVNRMWFRPNGIRIHGFRGMPMPELIRKGDKIVQYVWLDPEDTPDWAMVAVRGDGRFVHNAILGDFDFAKFKADYGNVIMFSELNHSIWHQIYGVFDPETYRKSVKLMGQAWADRMKTVADQSRQKVDAMAYQAKHFRVAAGGKSAPGKWTRIELDAEEYGLVGTLVDGFAYLTQNGRALWDYSVLERDGEVVRVFCEDSVGIDRARLADVRISVPGLKAGTKVKALFEGREIVAQDGFFADSFLGSDTYGYEGWAPEGDLFGYVKDPNRELPRLMPSGYGYKYGPTAVCIYEIAHDMAGTAPDEGLTVDLGGGITMEFVLVPAGSFRMGSETGRANERPVHEVTISKPFYLGKYEVTQEQWQAVMGTTPAGSRGPKKPVEGVSYYECQAFLKKLSEMVPGGGFRMPTEAEWEYACRAGTTTQYCFGDDAADLSGYGWYNGNSGRVTHPVGEKKSNAWGFHDMHGNVWEWCSDYRGDYPEAAVTDPKGGTDAHFVQLRGGSANYIARNCRSANRHTSGPGTRHHFVGLRVAKTPEDE